MLMTVSAAMLGWRLIALLGYYLDVRAERTQTAADDILITLILAAARLGIVIGGALGIAYFLSLPTSGILAGLGIGGLAFAFASKETLSNVFGAGILVSDRPFRHGDWISAGEVEGAIEHVGIRSTRVRTAQDSLMVVPNGKLADLDHQQSRHAPASADPRADPGDCRLRLAGTAGRVRDQRARADHRRSGLRREPHRCGDLQHR